MERRSFLKRAGALTIVVAGGHVWRSFGQQVEEIGSAPELEPWRNWRQDTGQGPVAMVRAAILSANAYNSQPWLFRVTDTEIDLYADVKRNLGAFDPYLREMYFSLGCALENLALAAAAEGYEARIKLAPGKLSLIPVDPKPVLVSNIQLRHARDRLTKPTELYEAIPHRHTNREPFDPDKPIPSPFVQNLVRLVDRESNVKVFVFITRDQISQIAGLIASSSGKFLADREVRSSVQPWVRTTSEEMRRLRDGFLMDARASRYGTLEAYGSLMLTGQLFGLIAVRDRYDRRQTLGAGRIWQRAHLLATACGIAARPANGAVELMDHERRLNLKPDAAAQLAKLTQDESWQPTFMFYMGYATVPAQASPRRSIEDVKT